MTENGQQPDYEGKRQIALANLDSALLNAALAPSTQKDFGEAGEMAYHNFVYMPALDNGLKFASEDGDQDLVMNALIASRQENGGKLYSGQLSEGKLIQTASVIIAQSLNDVKVSDILEKVSYEGNIPNGISDLYMHDLRESNEDLYKSLIGIFMSYHVQSKVGSALQMNAKATVGGLERILNPESSAEAA